MAGSYRNNVFVNTLFALLIGMMFSDDAMTMAQAQVTDIYADLWPVSTNVIHGSTVQLTVTVYEPTSTNQILDWFIEWDVDTMIIRLVPVHNLLVSSGVPYDEVLTQTITATARPEFTGRGTYTTSYSLTQDVATNSKFHTCNLTIAEMTIKDNCYIGLTHQSRPTDTYWTLLKQKVRLTVVPEPNTDPECTHNIHRSPDIDILTCISAGLLSNPQADLTWYENDQAESPAINGFNISEISSNPDLTRVFICHAELQGETTNTCTITLNPGPTTTTLLTTTTEDTPTYQPTTADNVMIPETTTENMIINPPSSTDYNGVIIGGVVIGSVACILFLVIIILQVKQMSSRTPPRQDHAKPDGGDGGVVDMTTIIQSPATVAEEDAYYTEVLPNTSPQQDSSRLHSGNHGNDDVKAAAQQLQQTQTQGTADGTSGSGGYVDMRRNKPSQIEDAPGGIGGGSGHEYMDLIRDGPSQADDAEDSDHAYASSLPYFP